MSQALSSGELVEQIAPRKKLSPVPVPVPQAAPASRVETVSIAGALLEAQRLIGGVKHDAQNEFHKFRYTSAEAMIGSCRTALHSAGLLLYRSGWSMTADGTTVVSTFHLSHPSTGQFINYEVPWFVVVEKGRPLDKAFAGSLTTTMGYFLRDLLLLPREEEDSSMNRRNDKVAEVQIHYVDPRDALRSLVSKRDEQWLGRVLARCGAELKRELTSIDEITDNQVERILKAHKAVPHGV